MKGHVPLKRHQALVSFSKDHHFGLLLVWKIKRGLANAVDPERISDYVIYFFDQELRRHFAEEEQFLFPMLEAGNQLRQRAENEHACIYELVRKLRSEKSEMLLQQFARALKEHIRFEERELFTSMQPIIDETGLIKLPDHVHRFNEMDADWHDAFWLR